MSNPNHPWRSERRRCWLVAFAAIGFAPFTARTARAADEAAASAPADDDLARAKRQLAIGHQAYDEARHEDALAAFESAYAAYPVADFQYNIGLCHERLGNVEAAITAFEAYLAGKPDAPDRATVERRIAVLVEQRPTVPVTLTASVPPPAPRPPSTADLIDPFPARSETPRKEDPRPKRMVTGGAISFALGVGLGVGGGVGFGVAEDRDTKSFRALQIASVSTGAVLVATGIGLMAAGKRKQRRVTRHAWLAPMPTGIAAFGRF